MKPGPVKLLRFSAFSFLLLIIIVNKPRVQVHIHIEHRKQSNRNSRGHFFILIISPASLVENEVSKRRKSRW